MSFFRVFDPGQQFFDDNGSPANGYQIFVYTAGTTTKVTTYKDNAGAASHTNPIILGSDGKFPGNELWVQSGTYKFVLASPTDTDPPSSGETLMDNVKGINDTDAESVSEWVASGQTPTRTGNTTFTMVGDQTTELHVGRRLRFTDASTLYGTIVGSSFSSPDTTITVEMDSGSLSASLSAVDYGIVSYANTSVLRPPKQLSSCVLAPHKNLKIERASTETLDIDIDEIILEKADGRQVLASSVNVTVDITASGANGLDTGSEANSTWYHLWIIAKEDGTVAGLMSTASDGGSITLPTDYVYYGYVGANYNTGAGLLLDLLQYDTHAVVTGQIDLAADTTIRASVTSQVLSVPPTARSALGYMKVRGTSTNGATGSVMPLNNSNSPGRVLTGYAIVGGTADAVWVTYEVLLNESSTIYIVGGGSDDRMGIITTGWRF